jgi:hypothetical protein
VIKKEDLQDRCKADAFTKAFAILQSGWLVVQSIARVLVGLPITQIELMTLSFVVCALVMYGLWWNKPFDAEREIILTSLDDVGTSGYRKKENTERVPDLDMDVLFGILFDIADRHYDITATIPFFALFVTGTVFSALHIAAWDWEFPSPNLRILWRIFGVAATGSALVPAINTTIAYAVRDWNWLLNSVFILDFIFFLVYIISRLGLIVVGFYCFSSMPASVYETVEWTNILPHLS